MVPGTRGGLGYKIDNSGIVPPLPGQTSSQDQTQTILGSGRTVCHFYQRLFRSVIGASIDTLKIAGHPRDRCWADWPDRR